jgi:hypothetical protein
VCYDTIFPIIYFLVFRKSKVSATRRKVVPYFFILKIPNKGLQFEVNVFKKYNSTNLTLLLANSVFVTQQYASAIVNNVILIRAMNNR